MTNIEWTHRPGTTGETWSPVTGCTPVSEGCVNCYAQRMAKRLAGRYGYPESPHEFDVTLHPDRLDGPLHWRKPRTAFVCSMSDLFHEGVSFETIDTIWHYMNKTRRHTFIVLTKRPQRMLEWMRWHDETTDRYVLQRRLIMRDPLPNVWGLVTAENQRCADERIPWLVKTPFAVRGVSIEPMLSHIDVSRWLGTVMDCPAHGPVGVLHWMTSKNCGICMDEGIGDEWGRPHGLIRNPRAGISWIVCGFETGPGARRGDFAWARALRDQCRAADVPFFWKRGGPGQDIPEDLVVREWPL